MSRRWRRALCGAAVAVSLAFMAGCSDSDDDSGGGDASGQPDVGATDESVDRTSTTVSGEVDGDDLVAVFLAGSGLTPDAVLSSAEHACMNEELRRAYPDGFPDDPGVSEEVAVTVDQAAETCDVAFLGSG